MNDTPAGIEATFLDLIMSRSPSERLAMACGMFDTGKALIQAGIRGECGRLESGELRRRTFLRLYAQDFAEDEREQVIAALADV